MNERIVIITGASPLLPDVVARIPADGIVLAADGGLDHARAAGLEPTGLVGDLDSISRSRAGVGRRERARSTGTRRQGRHRHRAGPGPRRGDGSRTITLIGGGDRLDHSLAAIGALGAAALTSIPTSRHGGVPTTSTSCTARAATLALVPGSTFSVLALHGPCAGCRSTVPAGRSTRSASNRWSASGSATRCSTTRRSRCRSAAASLTIVDEPAS